MSYIFEDTARAIDAAEAALAGYFETHALWLGGAIFALFAVVNSVRILAYVPQILCAARDQNGAKAISCTTWVLFLCSHLTTIAYAVVCAFDLVMALIFMGNAVACLLIVTITMIRRRAVVQPVAAARGREAREADPPDRVLTLKAAGQAGRAVTDGPDTSPARQLLRGSGRA